MSVHNDKDKTELFTVVGAPYVPEQHGEGHSNYIKETDVLPPETGVAVIWVVLYVAIFGFSLFAYEGFSKSIEVAATYLK